VRASSCEADADVEDEQRTIRAASSLTSTLLAHHIAAKLEMILDRETKLTHEAFAAQIESRIGAGDKGPDMKVWSKGKGLNNVRRVPMVSPQAFELTLRGRSTGSRSSLRTRPSSSRARLATTSSHPPSPARTIWRIRVSCSSPSACGTRATVRTSVARSWSIRQKSILLFSHAASF
jgi:hypothetical protein